MGARSGTARPFPLWRLDATHAKEFGIANIVVAPEDVDAEGRRWLCGHDIVSQCALWFLLHRSYSQQHRPLLRTSRLGRRILTNLDRPTAVTWNGPPWRRAERPITAPAFRVA
jgi:hypothetical protein